MSMYKCTRCGYKTSNKTHMNGHINRINLCKLVLKDINPKDYLNEILTPITKYIANTRICEYCSREFSRSDILTRHKRICKKKESKPGSKSDIKKIKELGYFYIFQVREHKRLNENVYKIGKTNRDIIQRFKEYPKGTVMKYTMVVDDCSKFEFDIKKHFKNIFIHRMNYGEEYFEGDICEMIKEMNNLLIIP
jgi:uncharacterized Zn-finger protein